MKHPPFPLLLLAVGAFLAPLLGGHVSTDQIALEPGVSSLLRSVFGGSDTPLLSHALASLPIALCCVLLLRRRVLQVPGLTLSLTVLLFFTGITLSILGSAFRWSSITTLMEWLFYGLTFFAVVAGAGRRGAVYLLGAIFCSGALLAVLGLLEYGANKATDPSWRIFSLWVGPNALAAMLLVSFMVGLGLLLSNHGRTSLIIGLLLVLIGFALLLTQSRGVLLSGALSLGLFVVLALLWSKHGQRGLLIARAGGVIVGIALLLLLLPVGRGTSQGGGTPLTRVAEAGEAQEQSSGFRRLLWQGAVQLVRHHPIGYGLGTYGFESTRPGLTTQTVYAHNAYLQLAVEASPVTPLLLLGAAGLWLAAMFRAGKKLPENLNLQRASVIAAVVGIGVHSMLDSDLYYFGIGLTVFMLLGVGLLLVPDSVAPEHVPAPTRAVASAATVLFFALFAYFGITEAARSRVRYDWTAAMGAAAGGGAVTGESLASAAEGARFVTAASPLDPEGWYLLSGVTSSAAERVQALERTISLAPRARNYRALARVRAQMGDTQAAERSLRQALRRDPRNLLVFQQLLDLQRQAGDEENAVITAEQLLAVEETPYFRTRSLPELVPTETYAARAFLAEKATDARRRAELLSGAVQGMLNYAQRTVPVVKRMHHGGIAAGFGGETMTDASQKLQAAQQWAHQLALTYRTLGDERRALEAEAAVTDFASVFADLSAK